MLPFPAGPELAAETGYSAGAEVATVQAPSSVPVPSSPSVGPMLAAVWQEAVAWGRTLFSAAVYATLIVTFGFQVARVEGGSMAPTLTNQDRLIVNKFAYLIGDPQPGDIVMMYYPKEPEKSFVKRVIAQEGDAVKIEDGRVYINGVQLADDFVAPHFRGHDDHQEIVVKEGYYYVLGDHRTNSADSREGWEVPKKYIVGRVQLRWWPVTGARLF